MGKFKERLRIRVMWMWFVVVSMVFGLTYLIFFLDKDKLAKGTDFITSFHSGVTFGIISWNGYMYSWIWNSHNYSRIFQ